MNKGQAITGSNRNYHKMKNSFAWIFGLIILIIFTYLGFNNFELPVVFSGKTEKVIGKIYKIDITPGIRGIGFMQVVHYAYFYKNEYYFGNKKAGKSFGAQKIGNRVSLEVSANNPEKKDVIGFFKDNITNIEAKYHSVKENGYYQIKLFNDIFFYTDFANGGIIKKELFGEVITKNDTLILKPFDNSESIESMILVYDIDTLENKYLIDLKTNRKFR